MAFFQPNPEFAPHDSGFSINDCSVGSPGSAAGSNGSHGSPAPENNQSDAGVSLSENEISKNAEISVSSPASASFDLKTETADFQPTGSSSPIIQPTGTETTVVNDAVNQPEQPAFNHYLPNHPTAEPTGQVSFHHNFYPEFTAPHQAFQPTVYENHAETHHIAHSEPVGESAVHVPVQPEIPAHPKPEPTNEPPTKRRRTDNRKFQNFQSKNIYKIIKFTFLPKNNLFCPNWSQFVES